ncbi:MAG: hydroxyacylglutathione hydrolase C-terminal domain-containing protein, partial [Gammaproteobacteria bacterium]
ARGEPTLPSDMEREHQVNVFLRTGQENVRQAVEQRTGRSLETEVDVFAALRTWKDEF